MRPTRAVVAAVTLGLVACGHPSNVLERTSGPVPRERVIIHARTPIRYGTVVTRHEGLVLQVQVSLENTSRRDQRFEYRWEWLDAGGFQLGDTLSNWQPGTIGGNERKVLTGVGPGPQASDFRLYLRSPAS